MAIYNACWFAAAVSPSPQPLYNQPIANTLLTLALGGLILNWLKERWARDEKKREKTLEFLEATGDRLNHLLSLIFGTLATENLSEECLKELRARRSTLFEKRFAVRLGAEAYIRSAAFWVNYEFLANHLYELVKTLECIAKQGDSSNLLGQVRGQRERIDQGWPLDDDPPDKRIAHSSESLNEVHRCARMLWHRSIDLISTPLQDEIRSRRKWVTRGRPTQALQRTTEDTAERR